MLLLDAQRKANRAQRIERKRNSATSDPWLPSPFLSPGAESTLRAGTTRIQHNDEGERETRTSGGLFDPHPLLVDSPSVHFPLSLFLSNRQN